MADTFNTVLLGIIEGITEFLPISSTGHLLVAEQWLGARSELFNVTIQAGAILAIVLIYWRRLSDLLLRFNDPANRDYLFKLTLAFLITAGLGFAVTHAGFKLPEKVLPIAIAELLGGILILGIEAYVANKPKAETVTWSVADLGRLVSDPGGCVPRHVALGRDHFCRHARRVDVPSGGNGVCLPGGNPDHVCRHGL